MGMNKLQANLCLLCVTLLWSTEVVIFACIPDSVLPFATTCITSFIGAALLFLCFFKRIISSIKKDGFKLIRSCLLLSVLDCSYNVMYIYGLNDFDVSTGAFTLSMTAVVLPVILLMRKENVDLKTWISAGLVLAGIMFALARNLFNISVAGFLLIFIGCIIRAFFIVRLNHFAKKIRRYFYSLYVYLTRRGYQFYNLVFLTARNLRRDSVEQRGYRELVYLLLLCGRAREVAEYIRAEARDSRFGYDYLFLRDNLLVNMGDDLAREPD